MVSYRLVSFRFLFRFRSVSLRLPPRVSFFILVLSDQVMEYNSRYIYSRWIFSVFLEGLLNRSRLDEEIDLPSPPRLSSLAQLLLALLEHLILFTRVSPRDPFRSCHPVSRHTLFNDRMCFDCIPSTDGLPIGYIFHSEHRYGSSGTNDSPI